LDFTSLGSRGSIDDVAARNGLQPDKKTIIGTTANLRELKRIELLLEACAGLEPESYQVLIVGDGPDRQRLMTISRDLGIHNRTIFTGMQKNVADYLAAMDIFVLPSGPRESFGNSIVEAMAVGLPAVVFADGGGLVEHVDDGKTGFIVNSVGELSDRLRCLMKEPSLRAELGQNAAAHVRNKYTLENMVRQYDRVYELALSPGKTA
jgi:glycosyltransferase involved in cell wall biosynthesis